MKQISAEEKHLVLLLTFYGISGAVAGLSFAHESRLAVSILVPLLIGLSSYYYSKTWFDCVSCRSMRNKNQPKVQIILSMFLFITCCSTGRGVLLGMITCTMRLLTLMLSSNRLLVLDTGKINAERRFTLMPPIMFVVVQSVASAVAVSFAAKGSVFSILIEAIPFSYGLLWLLTLKMDRDTVQSVNAMYALIILGLLAAYFTVNVFNPNLGKLRSDLLPGMLATGFVYVYGVTTGIPGWLEIIQVNWNRTDLGQKQPSQEESNKNYYDQLLIARVINMIDLLVVVVSWVYIHYSIYYLLLYLCLSSVYVILFRHHYVRINKKPYRGHLFWSVFWPVFPAMLVIVEQSGFLPPLLKIGDWSSGILTLIIEVVCTFLAVHRLSNGKQIQKEFYDLGLLGTHVFGMGVTTAILEIGPKIGGRNAVALFAMLVSLVVIVLGYIFNHEDPISR